MQGLPLRAWPHSLSPIYDLSHCSNVFMQIKGLPVKTCILLWSVRCTTNIRSEDYVFHVPVSIIGGDFFYFHADSESSTIPQVQLNIDFSLWVQKLLLQPEQFRRRARPLSSLEPGVDKYSPAVPHQWADHTDVKYSWSSCDTIPVLIVNCAHKIDR